MDIKQEKRLYITIDTEMDADTHWYKQEPGEFTSVTEGIPEYLRPIWDKYHIDPIYFVSPEVAENAGACEILKSEIAKGAIIGAHLHPEYIEPGRKTVERGTRAEYPCFAYDRETEKQKIINLKNLIEQNLGVTPVWYRAARFGADEDTYEILDETGFAYDSSVTPWIDWSDRGGPDHSASDVVAYPISGTGLTEYPVTIMGKRWGIIGRLLPDNWLFYRWLRPTHMTYIEERSLISECNRKGMINLVMMFHSMEVMINKTPYVRAPWMRKYYLWRLEKTIAFAQKVGYR